MVTQRSDRAPLWRVALIVGAAWLPALLVRLTLVVDLGLTFGRADVLGLTADLAVSLVVAAGLAGLARFPVWGRWAAVGLIVIWTILNFVNFEHIRELGSMVAMAHAGYLSDPTFLKGSALAPARPVLLIVLTIVSGLAVWWSTSGQSRIRVRGLLLIGGILLAPALYFDGDRSAASWRQANFVLAQFESPVARGPTPGGAITPLHRTLTPDLDGELAINQLPSGTNVLLVILEGVSGSYLPILRERHGGLATIEMPELDAVARRGLAWSTFVTHQRQTNRGEYALLCGDYPKLITAEPKMTELAGSPGLDCLPAALRAAGYSTTYLQAAPMAFMLKDQFMPQAGFEKSSGDTSFETFYHRNHWGIDDRAFLEHSLSTISDLQQTDRPWFLTLLTVGTHHPFNPPPDFTGSHPQGSPGWAMEYLDRAVGSFVSKLEEIGVLEDTLVLFTSDESRELVPGESDIANSFRQAWGFLIVLHPDGSTRVIDQPGMQVDLPISVVDALGLADSSSGFGGRSVFRSYREPRQILWGNTHLHIVAGRSADGTVAVCSDDLAACVASDDGHSLFFPGREMQPVPPDDLPWLIRGARESLVSRTGDPAGREFRLAPGGPIPVWDEAEEQFIFGGQFLTLPVGSRADILVEAHLDGASGGVTFHHDLIVGRRQEYIRTGRLEAGQTLIVSYSLAATAPLANIESRFSIDDIDGENLVLEFVQASIRLAPEPDHRSRSGIVEHAFSVK